MTATDRRERWLRRALLAFPRRWRDEHGDELVDVSRSMASDAGDRPSVVEIVDVIRGGLVVRHRNRPPWPDRLRYRMFNRPVPVRWHGWMRDDLRGRFLGQRMLLRFMVPYLALTVVLALVSAPPAPELLLAPAVIIVLLLGFGGGFKATQFRSAVQKHAGYDVMAEEPPSSLARPPVAYGPPAPRPRVPLERWTRPLGAWSMVAGSALVLGAALPNADRSVGPFTYAPDPNSPLTAAQVGLAAIATVGAAVALGLAVRWFAHRRARAVDRRTIHPIAEAPSGRDVWIITSVAGCAATVLGVSGAMPDLACTAVGASLVLGGSVLLALARVATTAAADLGRQLTMGDLIRGDRAPGSRLPVLGSTSN